MLQVAYPALGDPRGPGHAFLLRSVLPLPKQIAPAFTKKSCSTISTATTSLQPFLSVDYICTSIYTGTCFSWVFKAWGPSRSPRYSVVSRWCDIPSSEHAEDSSSDSTVKLDKGRHPVPGLLLLAMLCNQIIQLSLRDTPEFTTQSSFWNSYERI